MPGTDECVYMSGLDDVFICLVLTNPEAAGAAANASKQGPQRLLAHREPPKLPELHHRRHPLQHRHHDHRGAAARPGRARFFPTEFRAGFLEKFHVPFRKFMSHVGTFLDKRAVWSAELAGSVLTCGGVVHACAAGQRTEIAHGLY
eukprot:3322053-Rhodomonas_salina.2